MDQMWGGDLGVNKLVKEKQKMVVVGEMCKGGLVLDEKHYREK